MRGNIIKTMFNNGYEHLFGAYSFYIKPVVDPGDELLLFVGVSVSTMHLLWCRVLFLKPAFHTGDDILFCSCLYP